MEETTTRSRRWRIFFRVVIVGEALGVMLLAPLVGLALWPGLALEWMPGPESPWTFGWGTKRSTHSEFTDFTLAMGNVSVSHGWGRSPGSGDGFHRETSNPWVLSRPGRSPTVCGPVV